MSACKPHLPKEQSRNHALNTDMSANKEQGIFFSYFRIPNLCITAGRIRFIMIVVRNTFQLKFDKAKEAQALWKEAKENPAMPRGGEYRGMVDITGPANIFVLEGNYKDLADWESMMAQDMQSDVWRDWYIKFMPLCESSHRDIYKIVE
jgi:hypothetical protein